MSDDIFEGDEFIASRYCGPAGPADRRRLQIGVYSDEQWCIASLSADEARALAAAITEEFG